MPRRPRAGQGAALASYLLFESGFTRELIALGRSDAEARREQICGFMGWDSTTGIGTATPVGQPDRG